MATVFTNLTFYAAPSGTTGYRTPIAVKFEAGGEPDPGEGGGSENPDPGGPGGGSGGGGDIGNVGGSGTITIGDAPTLTRKTHDEDIYVTSGNTMTITYVADGDCTILPKGGYEDMTVSYNDNGREMTLSWTCPGGEPGDSTYIGAEAWVYGATDGTEAYTSIWDRLHVNKSPSDIVRGGIGQANTIIQDAAEAQLQTAGRTLIITDGVYSNDRDIFHVGYLNYTQSSAPSIANGVFSNTTKTDHVGTNFTDANVSKYTVIMAETPCGAIMNRNFRDGGISLYGNAAYPGGQNNGFRSVVGIKAKGFAIRNHAYGGMYHQRTNRTAMDYCSVVQATVYGQTPRSWTGDGACMGNRSVAYTNFEKCHVLGNERLLIANTFGGEWTLRNVTRGMLASSGCIQFFNENISQTFVSYGSNDSAWLNCYGIDNAYFAAGSRHYNGNNVVLNHCFSNTNGANNDILLDTCLVLNDVRAGLDVNESGKTTGNDDIVRNSVFWGRFANEANNNINYWIKGGGVSLDGVLMGRNEIIYNAGGFFISGLYAHGEMSNFLTVAPSWNTYTGPTESVIVEDGAGGFPTVGKLGIAAGYDVAAAIRNKADDYYKYTLAEAQTQGQKYISRPEPNSSIKTSGLGVTNLFMTIGRYGKFKGDSGWNTRYDGSAAQYVNQISRMPWLEFRRERRLYTCVSNGGTYRGNVGWAQSGMNPIDYINRWGTTPQAPTNAPYIEDIYGKALGGGSVRLWWRPVCAAYRSSITGYNLYIDGVKLTIDTTTGLLAKQSTSYTFTGVNTGSRVFSVQVVDPVNGNSGLSRPITITVT